MKVRFQGVNTSPFLFSFGCFRFGSPRREKEEKEGRAELGKRKVGRSYTPRMPVPHFATITAPRWRRKGFLRYPLNPSPAEFQVELETIVWEAVKMSEFIGTIYFESSVTTHFFC